MRQNELAMFACLLACLQARFGHTRTCSLVIYMLAGLRACELASLECELTVYMTHVPVVVH